MAIDGTLAEAPGKYAPIGYERVQFCQSENAKNKHQQMRSFCADQRPGTSSPITHNPKRPLGCGATCRQHTLPHACFQRIHALRAGTHACLKSLYLSSTLAGSHFKMSQVFRRKVIGYSCSTVPLTIAWCASHIVQRHKHTFIALL